VRQCSQTAEPFFPQQWWIMIDEQEARDFLDKNPDIEVLEAFVIDVNGVPRGKWIPRER
jgi:glutamine synthetase